MVNRKGLYSNFKKIVENSKPSAKLKKKFNEVGEKTHEFQKSVFFRSLSKVQFKEAALLSSANKMQRCIFL